MTTLAGWGGRIFARKENAGDDALAAMAMGQAKPTLRPRPFRVKLSGMVLILLRLPNGRQVRAAVQTLSTSGGLMFLQKPLDEKIEVELLFHVDHATIRARGQMLFPTFAAQGWLQPFRFVDLPEAARKGLESNLQSFRERMRESVDIGV
jgi:hypothetical protein